MPGSPEKERGLRALVVAAHPDDIDVNAAGTLRHWTERGVSVTYLVVTSGDAGMCPRGTRDTVAHTRRTEQRNAAHLVGVDDVRFLTGYADGDVHVTTELVRDIVRVIREVRPHRVMTTSPERRWTRYAQWHPDHLAVGEATVRAVYPAARNPHAFPELLHEEALPEWNVRELWIQDPPEPNHAEDVTDAFDVKLGAVLAHESQFPNAEETRRMLEDRLTADAVSFGLDGGRLVELFLRMPI